MPQTKELMKKIAVLTSGGDSPGMNACIRSVVRTAIYDGMEVYGIKRGYQGLIDGDIKQMKSKSVGNIIQRGGTILKSARCKDFFTKTARAQAYENLKALGIEGLVAIGGNGTFAGAAKFASEYDIPCIGIPGTIDNDLAGTDNTIGYDTAMNTVVEAIDKIRDTAISHNRLFVVEVMGRDAGFIALRCGIGVGAEAILIPESPLYIDSLIEKLDGGRRRNKSSGIVIVSEGNESGGAYKVAQAVNERFDHYEIRVSVLGHMQRGGNPSALDRLLASELGYHAVMALKEGQSSVMVGKVHKDICFTPLEDAIKHHKGINPELLRLSEVLSI
jgi:6-phosphofructokinase 1